MWKPLTTFLIGVLIGGGGVASIDNLVPYVIVEYYEEQYKDAMFQCDQVMREHFIAKKAIEMKINTDRIENLKAREIGLLVCQDYDRLRKLLGDYGVSDQRLALMGLEALEEKASDVRKFVEIHEIQY